VNGLQSNGDAWNSTSLDGLIGRGNGQDVHSIFDKHLENQGFDLHHAAVLAATLENFVHVEAVERLEAAYNLLDVKKDDVGISDEKMSEILKTYAVLFVLNDHSHYANRRWLDSVMKQVHKIYPGWNKTIEFLEEIRETVLEDESRSDSDASDGDNSWNTTLKVLDKFGERYGSWQNHECVTMKKKLVEMEDRGTGRVPLKRFYGDGLEDLSKWNFKESMDYLRMVGALDESDPTRVSVMIPNYLSSPSNCVAGSKFYDVCCIDECDALISHLERDLGAPEASPGQIINLVGELPSDTVKAPRPISDALSQRLAYIAEHHGGLVPLHGRLFAQWMHHAYPRECPFPHMSGTTTQLTSKQYRLQTGQSNSVHVDDIPELVQNLVDDGISTDGHGAEPNEERALPWSAEEELFVRSKSAGGQQTSVSWAKRCLLVLLSWLSVCAVVFQSYVTLNPKNKASSLYKVFDTSDHKYFV